VALVGSYFNIINQRLGAGYTVTVEYDVNNTETGTIEPFDVQFYLSDNPWISANDLLLKTDTVEQLDDDNFTTKINLPEVGNPVWSQAGPYYLGMIVNGEENNTEQVLGVDYDEFNIDVNFSSLPDLRSDFFDVLNEPLTKGSQFFATLTLENSSPVPAQQFEVGVYLSDNNYFSTNDKLLQTLTINNIEGNSTTQRNGKLTLPAPEDPFWSDDQETYYVGVILDPNNLVAEDNEANNVNQALDLGLELEDGLFLDYDDVEITNPQPPTTPPDLSGSLFDVIQEPLNAGDEFQVRFAVDNIEAGSADAFNVDFYLSKNDTFWTPGDDLLLGTTTVDGLAGNSSTGEIVETLTLPGIEDTFWSGTATYYVGMIINGDNPINEVNLANNLNQGLFLDYDDVNIVI